MPAEMPSTIPFPSTATDNGSTGSLVSRHHATALEVCDFVYGNANHGQETAASLDAVERFYEANASEYENPFITATSRSVISDIYSLARQLCYVDIPKPLAMLYILFRLKPPDAKPGSRDSSWFQGMRVWTEIGDICESESFDGHRRSIVEHTINVLFLPGIHHDTSRSTHSATSSSSLSLTDPNQSSTPHPTSPALPIPLTSLTLPFPSPLHLQLRIMTRLSFNEQGLITHHRDIWDVKDVLGLVPGISLAQWIGSRLAAQSLTFAARFLPGVKSKSSNTSLRYAAAHDLEHGSHADQGTPAAMHRATVTTKNSNALGSEGVSSPR